MTRDEVLEAIRAHLADELELDPARIDESTHFKEDLEADSLDLYTLVQELEDSYGVAMPDEQAARIHTVGRGRGLRPRQHAPDADRAEALTPEPAPRPARRAAGGSRAAGDHARVVDRAAVGLLRAARVPGRLGARPGRDHAPVSAAGGGAHGAGRLTKIRAQAVSGRSCRAVAERLGLPERLRAAAPPDAGGRRRRRSCAPSGCWPR